MDAPESNRSHSSKRHFEEKPVIDEDREHADRRKQSKSRKNNDEETEEQDRERRRKSSRDESDYDSRRDSHSKATRESPDEPRSSEGHRDKDYDSGRMSRDDGHESDPSRKNSTRASAQETSRGKLETHHEGDYEKVQGKDSKYSEWKESGSSRGKGREQVEEEASQMSRRRDETNPGRKGDEIDRSGSGDYDKHAPTRSRTLEPRYESSEAKIRLVDSGSEKDGGSSYREDKKSDEEISRKWVRSEAHNEHNRSAFQLRDTDKDDSQRSVEDAEPSAKLYKVKSPSEKEDKYKQQPGNPAYGNQDEVERREQSANVDGDGHTRTMKDISDREVRDNRRPGTPERSGWHQRESGDHDGGGFSEYENERTIGTAVKEWEKENSRDERSSKGKSSSWNERNREWDGSKERSRTSQSRQDTKDADREFDRGKECDSLRREQERFDNEKLHSRPGFRRDARMRPEDGKVSSSFRSVNEKSDSIEIRPNKDLDFGREESVSTLHLRRPETGPQQDFALGMAEEEQRHPQAARDKTAYAYADDLLERFKDDGSPADKNSGRGSFDSQDGKGRGQKGPMDSNRIVTGQSTSTGSQPALGNNQGSGSFNRGLQQGPKGGRPGRGGRRMSGRDVQRVGTPLPMMAPPFGHLGLTSGPLQPMGPNVSHSSVPPIAPGLIFPPLTGPIVWPGGRGVDMNMLAIPNNLPPIPPPGPGAPPRFASNMGSGPTHPMYFNQPGLGRGALPNISGPGFNPMGPISREIPHEKPPMGWGTPRNSGPSGKAPSRGEQNDYSQNFVDTGMRPQNFIRELELTSTVEDYPKLRELIQRKDEIVAKSSSPPMYYKCDLHDFVLTPEFFGTKFDVILVDPPWEEYVHRAPGVTDHLEYWSFEEIQNLKIEAIADTPSFIFLWVGDGVGLEQGRQCLKKWGFRRCEDICWVKTNKRNATPGLRHDSRTLFQHSKEHCLMGIKGTVRRSTDGHIIHANIDTDIIIAEEPSDGSTKKPEDMYRIIEHFALGRRRLELFGQDHNIRSGWLTLGKELSSSNFNPEAYIRNFTDKDGKIWQGGGGRNPPPEAGHLVLTTPEIESLRPKSPPPKNQQQPSLSLMTTGCSSNRRASANSPQNTTAVSYSHNQDTTVSEPATPAHWASSPMVGSQGSEGEHGVPDDKYYDVKLNASCIQVVGDRIEIDPRRANL